MMKFNSKAQSVIEYTTVIVLVIVGVLIMGPYVIRSINAFFKSGELQVEDSFREEIKQGPPTGGNVPTCDCDNYHVGACGDGFNCEYTQRVLTKYCEPLGCEHYFGIPIVNPVCQYDDDCCTPPEETGRCGDMALYAPCNPDEMEMVQYCGESFTPRYICEYNPLCVHQCEGLPLHPAAMWCGNEAYHYIGVPPSTSVTYVPPGGCTEPVPSVKCEAECIGNLAVNGSFEDPENINKMIPNCHDIHTSMPGWLAYAGAMEIHWGPCGWLSNHGNQYLEVQEDAVIMTEPLRTIPGKDYRVSFYYSPRPGKDENNITVRWNQQQLTLLQGNGQGLGIPNWQPYTFSVTAQGDDRLIFVDGPDGTPELHGGFIDNVSVGAGDGPGNPCCPCPWGTVISDPSCPAGTIYTGGCPTGQVTACD